MKTICSLTISVSLSLFFFAEARIGAPELFADDPDDPEIHVLIGYKSDLGHDHIKAKAKRINKEFENVHASAATLTKSKIAELQNDPDVAYVEEDTLMYPLGNNIPYGIELTQGNAFAASTAVASISSVPVSASACDDPDSFKVAVIDSGFAADHVDSPCRSDYSNCVGKSYGLAKEDVWNKPSDGHGTHVMGIIGAVGNNNIGINSMINDDKVCYYIARVFGRNGDARGSSIYEAFNDAVSFGAHVINMSLGNGDYSLAAQSLMDNAYNAGSLVVAPSGNGGGSSPMYPASYENVISVAAVDQNLKRASFSQYNQFVDIAAPGVDILSLAPPGNFAPLMVKIGATKYPGNLMQLSVNPPRSGIIAELAECSNFGRKCENVKGRVCLIERGEITFEEKTKNCENGGGVAAIIYNNVAVSFSGTLNSNGYKIPVLTLTKIAGDQVKYNLHRGITLSVEIGYEGGYKEMGGTSMAAPHVAGAAAAIWRVCRQCNHKQVAKCLLKTAKTIGSKAETGNGLVQTQDAYTCLVEDVGCCKA